MLLTTIGLSPVIQKSDVLWGKCS